MLRLMFTSYFVLIAVNHEHFVQTQTSILPLNEAANVGDKVVINCTTGASMIPRWRYTPTGTNPFTSISNIGSCNSLIPTRFVVESTGTGSCNLIIPKATTAEALAYVCDDGAEFENYTLVTIIESVEVSPNSAIGELCPGDPLNITCSVQYSAVSASGFEMFPSIMWTNLSANANITGTTPSPMPPKVTTSYLSITVTPLNVTSYTCNVYFNAPNVSLPGFATNAPIYYNSTNTAPLQVGCFEFDDSSIIVAPYYESNICEAKILECHPNAYPPPHDIHWLDVLRNETFNTFNITAEFGGEYICSVTNAIKTASVTYKLNDNSTSAMDKCGGVSIVNVTVSETRNKNGLHSNFYAHNSQKAADVTISNATEAIMTCTADGLPDPTYVWYDQCQKSISTAQQITVKASGSYECLASNSINDRQYSKSFTIKITLPGPNSITCGDDSDDQSDNGWLLLLILLILVFLLPSCVFLPYYGCSKSCRENVNDEFPWIEKALPCMNGKGCECSGGMVLFIFCLVICGIVFVPWILIASHCCQKNSKKSQGDNNSLQERNGSKNGRHQSGEPPREMSNSMGAPSQRPPAKPNSAHQVDHYPSPHASSLHSRPPPSNSRATNSPSPVSASGVEYGELMIDSKPGSRKPVELIIQKESAYAELHTS